jgi:hypothetical protein
MAGQTSRLQRTLDSEAAVKRKAADFQEAPGEAEAEAVHDAFLKGAGPEPEGVAEALTGADGAVRARALGRLQRQRGNAFVQRVVAVSRAQASAVGLPGRMVGLTQPEMVEEVARRKGGGSPLSDDVRTTMEDTFQSDMSDVRVHTDGEAAALSSELDAQAFTVGRDVFFADGRYDPGSSKGQAMLAHELTHVQQQTGVRPAAQRAGPEEEEQAVQAMAIQRAGPEEEEQAVQAMAVQRAGPAGEEEEALIQRQGPEEEEGATAG